MGHVQQDPFLPSSEPIIVDDFIQKKVGKFARIGELLIKDSIDIDLEPILTSRRKRALKEHPDEDPDLRFP